MSDAIPPKDRQEWAAMAQGQIKMDKYVLQLQIDRVSRNMESGSMTLDEATEYLYQYFLKYPKGFRSDLIDIFKQW
ncbi:MAG: hypothetical protein ACR2PX_01385 [Endozoicomonas sp.]|uniref:hypothetical protein n=1 Tax=Endozoicomonas sp. TaxID=1892382 RepID=UPI003D9ADFC0